MQAGCTSICVAFKIKLEFKAEACLDSGEPDSIPVTPAVVEKGKEGLGMEALWFWFVEEQRSMLRYSHQRVIIYN